MRFPRRGYSQLTTGPPFALNLSPTGDGFVRVLVRGELHLATSPELAETLDRELAEGRAIVVDLSRVTFIDSTAEE